MSPDPAPPIGWLADADARIGLGCMRLSSGDPERAIATIHAALDGGVRVVDTARAYLPVGGELGASERLVARALASHPAGAAVRVVTKGGMTRPEDRKSTRLNSSHSQISYAVF